jgi:hypothetical protein
MELAARTFSCQRTKFLGENQSNIPIEPQMFAKSHFSRLRTPKTKRKSSFAGHFGRQISLFYFFVVVAPLQTAAIGRIHLRQPALLSDKIFY